MVLWPELARTSPEGLRGRYSSGHPGTQGAARAVRLSRRHPVCGPLVTTPDRPTTPQYPQPRARDPARGGAHGSDQALLLTIYDVYTRTNCII